MTEASPRLTLPYLAPSQAQKHVTHNEALARLDMLVQASAVAVDAKIAPPAPTSGTVYALGAQPSGAWSGHAHELALWDGTGWTFAAPPEGLRLWSSADQDLLIWQGTQWISATAPEQMDGLGVNAAPDATNRLAVSADATLLSHDGGGHQLKINKASDSDSASLLFQSNWTGHAEMGLAGNTDFSVKVSPDGASWVEALRVDAASGTLSGAAVQNGPQDATAGRLMRADFGYSPANLVGPVTQTAGTPTGAVIERGDGPQGSFTRFADGTLLCWARATMDVTSSAEQVFAFPSAFSAPPAVSVAQLTSAPNPALECSNLRGICGVAGADQHWAIRLKSAGVSSDPSAPEEGLMLSATGRWV